MPVIAEKLISTWQKSRKNIWDLDSGFPSIWIISHRIHPPPPFSSCSFVKGILCTDKKENKIFFIFEEIQSKAVAKSYVRQGFLIYGYEEMRKYLVIYEEAVSHI